MRVFLNVPYDDKETAKEMGARWDPEAKSWYAPEKSEYDKWFLARFKHSDSQRMYQELLEKYKANNKQSKSNVKVVIHKEGSDAAAKEINIKPSHSITHGSTTPMNLLRGEDRHFGGSDIYLDVLPSSCWAKSLRLCLNESDYERIATYILERTGSRCELCGALCVKEKDFAPLMRWDYLTFERIMRLKRILTACSKCEATTRCVEMKPTIVHLVRNFELTKDGAIALYREEWRNWREKNSLYWNLDMTLLAENGFEVQNRNITNVKETKETTRAIPRQTTSSESALMTRISAPPADPNVKQIQIQVPRETKTKQSKQQSKQCSIQWDSDGGDKL